MGLEDLDECSIDSTPLAVSDRIPGFAGTVIHTYGKTLKPKNISATGYTFKGWKVADGNTNGLTIKNGCVTGVNKTNTEDHELYAVFTENVYNVKLNTRSGFMRNAMRDTSFKGTQPVIQNVKSACKTPTERDTDLSGSLWISKERR